jgi:hypothetical protein
MDEDKEIDTALSDALQQLLFRGSGSKVQVMYVTLKDGRQLIFLGSPLKEEDYDQIVDFMLGETIDPVVFSAMAAVLGGQVVAH